MFLYLSRAVREGSCSVLGGCSEDIWTGVVERGEGYYDVSESSISNGAEFCTRRDLRLV